ncbi:unnamed protein product [Arabidopsis lyrata]|uniref:Uncharacterized protein n=1 Tax=Arabidopsis lyrata subsp. lyrata TaxID=81972 RepID=D7L489_ARALL|nr:hypothetical protein ARALYDRAFT_898964 [Arabidopsis lyrata subsp. lyrata]CAH8261645.1 unnamed protein product [Arabidopsis lyrata]
MHTSHGEIDRFPVVYVGFGSEAKPSQTEINSIALGLELSGLPFFWVLKTRRGPWDTEPVELPEGFEERTAERGMVWRQGRAHGTKFETLVYGILCEEKKFGYMIPRDETEGFFTKENVAKSLRLVMEEEEGKVYRENVKDMKGVFGDLDRQDRYVDSFLDFLVAHR